MGSASSSSDLRSLSQSWPRTLIRTLAHRATRNPIEVIVTVFIIVTLAYFQLLKAVAHSDFFEPLKRDAVQLAAASSTSNRTPPTSTGAIESQTTTFFREAGGKSAWQPLADDAALHPKDAMTLIIEPVILADSEKGSTSPSAAARQGT